MVMTVTIRAHFDGKVIVPHETVTLPTDTPLTVHVETPGAGEAAASDQQRQVAYETFLARVSEKPVPHLADEALRRESICEDYPLAILVDTSILLRLRDPADADHAACRAALHRRSCGCTGCTSAHRC